MFSRDNKIQCAHFTGTLKGKCHCSFECDCYHLSEAHFADIERKKISDNRVARKKLMRAMLEDESNPLRAVRHEIRAKL